MSNLINKAKAVVSGHKHESEIDNPRSTNAGPHSSNVLNQADPRVDSDRDGRNDPTSRVGGYGNTQSHQTVGTGAGYGSGGTYGTTGGTGYGTTGGTVHNSALANKIDPRVDSDLDGSRTAGGYGNASAHHSATTAAGPHSSNLANRLDPRVDSDLDGSRTAGGYGATGTTGATGGYGGSGVTSGYASSGTQGGATGGYGASATHGHQSHLANQVDPRIDSDRDGSRITGGYGNTGTGVTGRHTAQEYESAGSGRSTNAGPHNSNLLNKLDPRVDSDRDGGKTYGGNATYR